MIFMSPGLRVLYPENKEKECCFIFNMIKLLFHSEGDFNYFRQHSSFLYPVIFKQNFMWAQTHSLHSWRSIDCLFSDSSNSFCFKSFMFILKIQRKLHFSPVANWLVQNLCYRWWRMLTKAHPWAEWDLKRQRPFCIAVQRPFQSCDPLPHMNK